MSLPGACPTFGPFCAGETILPCCAASVCVNFTSLTPDTCACASQNGTTCIDGTTGSTVYTLGSYIDGVAPAQFEVALSNPCHNFYVYLEVVTGEQVRLVVPAIEFS
jgi:hypothetical protein